MLGRGGVSEDGYRSKRSREIGISVTALGTVLKTAFAIKSMLNKEGVLFICFLFGF